MSWGAVLLALQTVWVVPTPPPRAPVPVATPGMPSIVVERIITRPGERTRLSLFSNGIAVVSLRSDGAKPSLFKRTLDRQDLVAYLIALQDVAGKIRALSSVPDDSGGPAGTITIHLAAGPGPPIDMRYSPLSMMPLAIGRLGSILDDLQAKVLATPPGYDEVSAWTPREGDVVEMTTGQKARVTDINTDGSIVVSYEDVGVTELIPKDERTRRIRRILSRAKP